jgi:hypothetical protein
MNFRHFKHVRNIVGQSTKAHQLNDKIVNKKLVPFCFHLSSQKKHQLEFKRKKNDKISIRLLKKWQHAIYFVFPNLCHDI